MKPPTRFGLYLPNFGELAKPDNMIKLARLAEENGWEGLFLWDHIPTDESMAAYDPLLLLSLVATNTETLRIGTSVTPLARRRPWKVAKEVVTLDHISNGRFTLGIGLGVEAEFVSYGESFKLRETAEKLDESIEILRLLWSGELVDYQRKAFPSKSPAPAETSPRADPDMGGWHIAEQGSIQEGRVAPRRFPAESRVPGQVNGAGVQGHP